MTSSITLKQLANIAQAVNVNIQALEQILKDNDVSVQVNQSNGFRYSKRDNNRRRSLLSLY